MRIQLSFAIRRGLPMLLLILLATCLTAAEKKKPKKNDVCAQPNPESLCTAANTCGSGSAACTVDVQRTADSSSLTPSTSEAKSGKPFCVAAGTKVEWKSTAKETGFIIDAGAAGAFEPGGAIIGGMNNPVSNVATKAGCYNLSFGACRSGGIYGMCQESSATIIIKAK